jgi:predicted transcriptional regulator
MNRIHKSRHPIPGDTVSRLSISLSGEDKEALEGIAEEKRVSLAWVLRDAVSHYLAENEAATGGVSAARKKSIRSRRN